MGVSMIWAGIPEGLVMWLLDVLHYRVGLIMNRPHHFVMHYCCLCLILSLSKLNKTHVCACVSVHAGVTSSLISPTNFFWHNLSVTCNSVSSRLTGDWVPGSVCLHSPLLELQVQSCLDFCLFLTWVWGSELRFSCLCSKHFTPWAVSFLQTLSGWTICFEPLSTYLMHTMKHGPTPARRLCLHHFHNLLLSPYS